jgi:hypothetical protein
LDKGRDAFDRAFTNKRRQSGAIPGWRFFYVMLFFDLAAPNFSIRNSLLHHLRTKQIKPSKHLQFIPPIYEYTLLYSVKNISPPILTVKTAIDCVKSLIFLAF